MRYLPILLLLLILSISAGHSHEVTPSPSCKQGFCVHALIRYIQPVQYLSSAALIRYEAAYVIQTCKSEEAMDEADCYTQKPDRRDFSKFVSGFALCSAKTPAISQQVLSTESSKQVRYVNNYLNPVGEFAAYQSSAIVEYLIVCHGWEPKSFDDKRYLAHLGYKAIVVGEEQTTHDSEAAALLALKAVLGGQQGGSYLGRWYDGTDRSVCKEQPGTADGLLVYTEKEAIGLESWCRIAGKKVTGDRTDLTLRCRSEGNLSTSQESLQVVSGRLQRTLIEGRKRYVFSYNRCP